MLLIIVQKCNQEEAEARTLYHLLQKNKESFKNFVIHSPNKDMFILTLAITDNIRIYFLQNWRQIQYHQQEKYSIIKQR